MEQVKQRGRRQELAAFHRREDVLHGLADRLDVGDVHSTRGPLQAVRMAEDGVEQLGLRARVGRLFQVDEL